MKKRYPILFFLISCMSAFIFVSPVLAVEDEDILYPTISKKEEYPAIEEKVGVTPMLHEKKIGDFKIDLSASVLGGFDTNVYLEHYDGLDSLFAQESFTAQSTYALSDSLTLRADYDVVSIKYLRSSDADLIDNIVRTGLDAKIGENFLWSLDYVADFVRYPHDEQSEYTINAFETALRHDITDWLYQKATYKFSYKHYPKWKVRNNSGRYRLGDREDIRNTIEHQLGIYLGDKTFLKADNTVYFNNSNEPYLDYYDYMAVKTKGTVIQLITNKLYGSVNFGYELETYENRRVSDRADDDQINHLLMGGASLFYDITPLISVGTSFDYRKNFSNEGVMKYTDYIISSGIYCKF